MTALPSYAVVTPARNELANLGRLAGALRTQRLRPDAWVIVDDGSDDGTAELAAELAAAEPWIHGLTRAADSSGTLTEGRREGRDLIAFRLGVRSLPAPSDVVVKVDADLSFEPDYFERLMERFHEDPQLGMAGGANHELEDGRWVRRRVMEGAVWGASRAYRWDCLDAVMTLEPRIGWDGLDEVRAQLRGWRTATFNDLPFLHHRPEHTREPGRVRAHMAQGRAAWYMGYRPSYLALRTVYRSRQDPAVIGMAWGYVQAAAARDERFPEADVRRVLRGRQRLRRTLRRGAPR